MVYNSDLMFQENEGLKSENSRVCTENSALRAENNALKSTVNSQNTCGVCGNDSPSSTVSDQIHLPVIVSINCAFVCWVTTKDVFFLRYY